VSIDVHKYYHLVMIHNDIGEIVSPSFRIDTLQAGFEQLCAEIDRAVDETESQLLLIGMEPTGHYFENLAFHLSQRYEHVRLVNSFAVKMNREQKMLQRQKTDEIDLASIGDLVLRNECFPYRPLSGVYLQLQYWVREREAKVKARTRVKNQIIGHMDRIFPGLVRRSGMTSGALSPLFSDFWACQTAQDLLRICPNPHALVSMEPEDLISLFHDYDCRLGPKGAAKIIEFAKQVLLPNSEVVVARLPLLETDLALLDHLDRCIAQIEAEIERYLAETKGQILTQIKGIGTLRAAYYVAGIGDPTHYQNAGQTFKRSGLVSGRNDSGIIQRQGEGQGITRVGDPHLRGALVQLARGLCQWQPYFGQYRERLIARGKHPGVAIIATARKANGVLFALMRDQTLFDPRDEQGQPIPPRRSLRDKEGDSQQGPKQSDA
jgi:transposase